MLPLFLEASSGPVDDEDEVEYDGRLTDEEIRKIVGDMWLLHVADRAKFDRIYEYVKGLRGRPNVPDGASDEVKEIAALSIKNVLRLVRDTFAQNLSVVGYRGLSERDNDPAWRDWQRNRMDARQAEVHRPSTQYGSAYVTVTPGPDGTEWRTRSPRQMLAVYDDPVLDAWPQFALETWVTHKDAKPQRRGLLLDDRYMYELDLGEIPVIDGGKDSSSKPITVRRILDVTPHGATDNGRPVCPVVRFVNDRDADDMIVGEIEPLIGLQRAINCVNFDRMLVSRFGANPQRVISGWTGSKNEVLKASALRVWTFEDPEVRAQAFPPASVEPYNSVLEEMMQHVAMEAQISPTAITGSIANVSADALAAAMHNMQLKLTAKRESFGESWEQVLRLSAAMGDDPGTADDILAEVIWRDTEARSFAGVVDGVVKLAQAGVPIEYLLPLVPGMTQQVIQAIKTGMRSGDVRSLVDKLLDMPPPGPPEPPPLSEVLDQVDGDGGGGGGSGARVSGVAG